jgi:hypothetical protein
VKVQIENAQGEIIRHEEMTLEQLNTLQNTCREYFYTPLGPYVMCEMCDRWHDKEDSVFSTHPRIKKSAFCSDDCCFEATEECDIDDRSEYLDWDYRMNY